MKMRQTYAKSMIINLLLALPYTEREEVCRAIMHNGIFCFSCGYGEPATPNPNCQCGNDT